MLVRHRQTKETATDRLHLRDTAPVLDPTQVAEVFIGLLSMARPLRIEYDGALYHITSRGNERKAIFKTTVIGNCFYVFSLRSPSISTGYVMPTV